MQRPGGRFDSIFFLAENDKRFKSMTDVARFLNLNIASAKGKGKDSKPSKGGKTVAEKKRLKRELDKLVKLKVKATKSLEDHNNEDVLARLPVGDDTFWDDGSNSSKAHEAGVIVPKSDIESFPGIPTHCIPDLLMVWDFLCTFSRTLSLQPIELDDFAAALSFRPSAGSQETPPTDEQSQLPPQLHVPVYLSECHIALLRLLIKDESSDHWWWSVLETPEMVEQEDEYAPTIKRRAAAAVVKIDMEALLSASEDPAVTRNWLQSLEDVRNRKPDSSGPIKSAVKAAIATTTNQHVKLYLKKAMRTWKNKSAGLVKRAVVWLIERVREARPDLWGRSVSEDEIAEHKKLVAAEAAIEMDNIIEDEAIDEGDLNLDEDSDEESDSDADEGSDNDEDEYADQAEPPKSPGTRKSIIVKENDEITPVSTFVPEKPLPSVADLLLPPAKIILPSDLVHPLTWPPVVGATSCRIFQWYKRRRNEVDDSIREFRELRPMSVAERRRREMSASLRILSECGEPLDGETNHVESAINHLCDGNDYLTLNAVQRLSILRILIEAAYDTSHVSQTIEDNFNARTNAGKALDAEEKRAKKAARQELATIESAARDRLAIEAQEAFIMRKREELLEDIKESNGELTMEFYESLTDDDIIDLDEESKTEYEALPKPASFNKGEVNAVVKMIKEETAFGAEKVTVLTLKEIEQMDEDYMKSLEEEIDSYGEIDSRETSAKVDRVRQKITKLTDQMQSLPQDRNQAIEDLRDAMEDGTIKTLRMAIKQAKLARLVGDDEKNGGIWALDLARDASLELKDAEGRKRVTEAQKDLVAKRNKCFTRTEPLGRDRYQSSFVRFDHDKDSRVWAERNVVIKDTSASNENNGAVLLKSTQSAVICAPDKSDDFVNRDDRNEPYGKYFVSFANQEYHHSGKLSALARHHWSCYTTDRSLRVLVKNLDGKCPEENALKEVLKETIETFALAAADTNPSQADTEDAVSDAAATTAKVEFLSSGDEEAFCHEKKGLSNDDADLLKDVSSAIGKRVRLRTIPNPDRDPDVAEYSMGTITGWKIDNLIQNISCEGDAMDVSPAPQASVPIWRLWLDDGDESLISATDVVKGIIRAIKWSTGYRGYVEHDAPFLSYRNSLGRFCGRAVEAPSSQTPQAFAKQMVKKEQDLYMPLKNRTFENNWGGKAGARQAWVSSLKECGHAFDAVRDGLLTLENAFFELTGGFGDTLAKKRDDQTTQPPGDAPQQNGGSHVDPAAKQSNESLLSGKDLLHDDVMRFEIELESIGAEVKGLWNNPDSREIFHELMKKSKTVSILALGLELICRNAQAYINATKSSSNATTEQQPVAYLGRRRAAMQRPGAYADYFK